MNNVVIGPFGQYNSDEPSSPLSTGGGGGTFDPMEARVAKLEAHVEHIQSDISSIKEDVKGLRADARTDFRLLFGAMITGAIGLAAMMAKGFGWL